MNVRRNLCVGINATALLSPRTGIGNYVYALGKAFLSSPEIEPRFFYVRHWSGALRDEPLPNIALIKSATKNLVPNAYAIKRFLAQSCFGIGVRRNPIDLYHEPNYLAYRFAGPTVTTVHDLSWIRHPETHPKDRLRAMDRYFPRALEGAAALITDCQFVKNELVDVFGVSPARIYPVPLGVSSAFSRHSEAECTAALSAHDLQYGHYFLSVGTLEPRKNLLTLLDAFCCLKPDVQRCWPLALAGMHGWLSSDIEAKMRPLVEKGVVKVLGYVPDTYMPMLYSGATAFVFPSLYEGFGLPPLEAMACGTPVIASNSSSIPEVVGDAGVLCEARDVDTIAVAMLRMVEDADWRENLSRLGIARAGLFTWQRTADVTIGVYRRALEAN